jgi:hypothetical protein
MSRVRPWRSRFDAKDIGVRTNSQDHANSPTQLAGKCRSGVLMPCRSRQCGLRTMRPSDPFEFASTCDRIAAIVHTQLLVSTLGAFFGAPPGPITEGPGGRDTI